MFIQYSSCASPSGRETLRKTDYATAFNVNINIVSWSHAPTIHERGGPGSMITNVMLSVMTVTGCLTKSARGSTRDKSAFVCLLGNNHIFGARDVYKVTKW